MTLIIITISFFFFLIQTKSSFVWYICSSYIFLSLSLPLSFSSRSTDFWLSISIMEIEIAIDCLFEYKHIRCKNHKYMFWFNRTHIYTRAGHHHYHTIQNINIEICNNYDDKWWIKSHHSHFQRSVNLYWTEHITATSSSMLLLLIVTWDWERCICLFICHTPHNDDDLLNERTNFQNKAIISMVFDRVRAKCVEKADQWDCYANEYTSKSCKYHHECVTIDNFTFVHIVSHTASLFPSSSFPSPSCSPLSFSFV